MLSVIMDRERDTDLGLYSSSACTDANGHIRCLCAAVGEQQNVIISV